MAFLRVAFVSAFLFAALIVSPVRAGVFNPESTFLSNGMQVVVIPNHRVPVVTHMVWYKVGAADEPPGLSGIAHYFEHLMFKGTKKYPDGVFSQTVARNGGKENAFTSQDYTGYYQTVAKDRLETMMKMEADRMTNLTLTAEQIEPERLVILEERRSRTDNNPQAILQEQIFATLYRNHPYGIPIIGWEHEIKTLPIEELISFYKRWYAPNNAILVVAGDITLQELLPLAERYYGVIPSADTPERLNLMEPPSPADRVITFADPRVRQPVWSRTYLAPSYLYGKSELTYGLEVLEEIISGGATSRLYKALVVDQKIAVSAGASYDAGQRGPSAFTFYASPAPGVSLEKLEAAIEAEVQEVLDRGVTADEVAQAKKRMTSAAIYARDSLSGGGWAIGSALAMGGTIDLVESWPDKIRAVSPDLVMQAARHVLTGQGSVTAKLLPKSREGA